MMQRGQRLRLGELGVTDAVILGVGYRGPGRFQLVVAGLDAAEKLVDRAFLLSVHQPRSFEGSVRIEEATGGDRYEVFCELERVPASVTKVWLVLSGVGDATADALGETVLRIVAGGAEVGRFTFDGAELAGQRTILLGELYRHDGWRLALLGTGYRSGLDDLLQRIGGPHDLPGAPPPPPPVRPTLVTRSPAPAPAPAAPAAPAVPPPAPAAPATPAAPPAPAPVGPPPAPAAPAPPEPPSRPLPPPPDQPRPAPPHLPAPAPPNRPGLPARPAPVGGPPARPGRGRKVPVTGGLSLRERIVSPRVARAAISPVALGLFGGGVLTAVTAPISLPVGFVIGVVAWGGRVAFAVPKRRAGERIDPFTLRDPWRTFVRDALEAKARFDGLVERSPTGPLRDRLAGIAERIQSGVLECWRIARQGQSLTEARLAVDADSVRAELAALSQHGGPAVDPTSAIGRTAAALRSQLETVDRLDRVIDDTYDRLRLLDARLDETVARAFEISVTATDAGAFAGLGADVDEVVTELESLRLALEETHGAERRGTGGN